MPIVELLTVALLVAIVGITYFIVSTQQGEEGLLTPPVVATLLVANLVPAMALMVLVARRFAMRRAARSPIGGKGRLHVRLVAIFSLIAAVPTLMVVVFASLIFQVGNEFWFSPGARTMIENANTLGRQAYTQERDRVVKETVTMSADLSDYFLPNYPIDSLEFMEGFGRQTLYRNLSEALIVQVTPDRGVQTLALVNPYDRQLEKVVTQERIAPLRKGQASVVVREADRMGVITPIKFGENTYLYAARVHDNSMVEQLQRAEEVLKSYNSLVKRARVLQLRFNAALILVSLLITGAAVWIALKVADKLVRPVSELVDAAKKVTAGDLSARVPPSTVRDEVGTLGNAFNRMTRRLEEQTGALVSANGQLDSRRMFMEAVLSGVSAGVISVDEDREVRLTNSSAEALLKTDKEAAAGRKLADLAPELNKFLDGREREDIIQVASAGEPRTLAVKRVRVESGYVLTFDDITEQLLDQRRAAWSDVARRIAHEIKNPLTPIQLAAERLQRRYGKEISSDPGTFEQLTGTIVRQVGDLRRMVDEFSSFARMPKPIFRQESVAEVARHALFLHEVAHPDIAFSLDAPEPSPLLVCDRRQLGQALTNVVKNAVEAIQQKRDDGRAGSAETIAMIVREGAGRVCIDVQDTGIGLPPDRGRLTEPYMTTRVKGTGLGLAIVKKIVEEHFGSISFEDAPGGGTIVRLAFDAETLARLDGAGENQDLRDMAANG
ncbi:PAS domain-containing sensor histidine kinase [Sphingomonas deserti]|uniref:histidine kinase n=1 Tax=Allosphingosinicella deserti TaxID=2116704 RepID=A0A2P7QHJ2_9SPHN|nr:PAS domain-containing sensor histidine kinase [Sphingomonas deserti]